MSKRIVESDQALLGQMFFKNSQSKFIEDQKDLEEEEHIGICGLNKEGYDVQNYYVVNNNDGTIRWVYPAKAKRPLFLSFYNASSKKAKLFKLAFRMIFFFGMSKRFNHGSFAVYSKTKIYLDSLLNQVPHDDFAVFTGTVGSTRKFVLATSIKNRLNYFIKMAWLPKGIEAVENEKKNLQTLAQSLKGNIPGVLDLNEEGVVAIENVKTNSNEGSNDFKQVHVDFIERMSKIKVDKKVYFEHSMYHQIQERLDEFDELEITNEIKEKDSIINSLRKLHQDFIAYNKQITFTWSHQDFTPWNMYVGKERLAVYDFELAEESVPALFDFFHFFMQRGVLIEHKSFSQIREDIDRAVIQYDMDAILGQNINIDQYFQLYLMIVVSYYLKRYLVQDQLHIQAHWLTAVWNDALLDLTNDYAT